MSALLSALGYHGVLSNLIGDRIVKVCEWDRDLAVRSRVAKPAEMVTIHNAMPDVEAALRAEPQASPPRLLMVFCPRLWLTPMTTISWT